MNGNIYFLIILCTECGYYYYCCGLSGLLTVSVIIVICLDALASNLSWSFGIKALDDINKKNNLQLEYQRNSKNEEIAVVC